MAFSNLLERAFQMDSPHSRWQKKNMKALMMTDFQQYHLKCSLMITAVDSLSFSDSSGHRKSQEVDLAYLQRGSIGIPTKRELKRGTFQVTKSVNVSLPLINWATFCSLLSNSTLFTKNCVKPGAKVDP